MAPPQVNHRREGIMKYITKKYPFFKFYIGEKSYRFWDGEFDVSEKIIDSEEQAVVIARLEGLRKGDFGITKEEDYGLPYPCKVCPRTFATQAALWGHKSAHITPEELKAAADREGGRLPTQE